MVEADPQRAPGKEEAIDLGWRAQSSMPPRKATPIEGLGPNFGLKLSAAVLKKKEEFKAAETDERKPLPKKISIFDKPNGGVAARIARDKEQEETPADRLAQSQAKLAEKALLYERFSRGEAQDEGESYEVDFFQKVYMGEDAAGPSGRRDAPDSRAAAMAPGDMMSEDMRREQERQRHMQEEWSTFEQEEKERVEREQRADRLADIEEETAARAEEWKDKKRKREEAKRKVEERHKRAFLKQFLTQAKQAKPS